MLFTGFVVAEKFALQDVFEQFASDGERSAELANGAACGQLQRIVGGAGVAVGIGRNAQENLVAGLDVFVTKSALFVANGAAQQLHDLRRGERIENIDLGAREQRRNDLEGGILGGCADEGNVTGLDVRKKRI